MAFTTQKYSGSGAISLTHDPASRFILEQIRLTVTPESAATDEFLCTLDSAGGVAYDSELLKESTQDARSLVCSFSNENKFENGDKLAFSWPNSDGRSWGLEIRVMVL
jgi:hypothetical protein